MISMIMINLVILMISSGLFFMNLILSKKKMLLRNKLSPFECGFDPMSCLRLPFSIHFFLIAIIFLIFDVEISLIFPVIKYFSLNNLMNKNIFIIILLILIFGLYYEWKEGSLKWLKMK